MNSITEQIIETAYYCGKILINADRTKLKVDEKEGQANFVTDYDRRIEEILRDKLSETVENAAFIGEEGEYGSFEKEGYVYIVDPIDGTTNFIKDYHASCISIALLKEGEPYIGVIYNPYLDEINAFRGRSRAHRQSVQRRRAFLRKFAIHAFSPLTCLFPLRQIRKH